MLSVSNSLSFLRAPLALLFLLENSTARITAIILAMLTDSIDGYIARKSQSTSQFGAILDPVMDKFFVFFALSIFLYEGRLQPWQACAMISRDFFLCLFAIYLGLTGSWSHYECKAIRWGKVTTALQFVVLIALSLNIHFPSYVYLVFMILGILAFLELLKTKNA